MPIVELYSGFSTPIGTGVRDNAFSLTASGTGLRSRTEDGVYQAYVQMSGLIYGDIYNFIIYEKLTNNRPQVPVYNTSINGPQTLPLLTPPLLLMHGWDMTMSKYTGTSPTSERSMLWSIRQIT
jgi:hypothetical protein